MLGKPKLEPASFPLDHAFGPTDSDAEIFAALGAPLIARAQAGQVGVIMAYGQTGSGKTHTMSMILERVSSALFAAAGADVGLSYFEALGPDLTDCLASAEGGKAPVQIGEMLDGSVVTRNLSTHRAASHDELAALVKIAQGRRATASTERNDESSRSHGIAVLTVGRAPAEGEEVKPAPGVLYIVDLAGSERAADSKVWYTLSLRGRF